MQDGILDVSLLTPTSPLRTALDFRRLYDGQLAIAKGVTSNQCSSVYAEPVHDQKVEIELDGESHGYLPATFTLKKKALNVRGGWSNDR